MNFSRGGRLQRRFHASFSLVKAGDCGDDGTFEHIQRRIIGPRGCRVETCHGSARSGGLDLRFPISRDTLVDAPAPPNGSFDPVAADRGELLFEGHARCSTCHNGPAFSDADEGLHDPDEVGTDPMLAERGTTGMYRTTPLRGAWQHPPYFHDGSAPTLLHVVEHYDDHFKLGLTPKEKQDLVEYLKSL